MIRARVDGTRGRAMMLLGLSGENVTRLVADEPIFHRMEDAGFPGIDLVVIYGATEDETRDKVAAFAARLVGDDPPTT